MYPAVLIWRPSYAQLSGLLIWIGGVIATIIGSWIASKFRVYHDNRKAHLEELKEKVLVPVRNGIATYFGAVISQQAPLLAVQWAAVEFDQKAKVTEEVTEEGEVLVAPFPVSKVFGSLHSAFLQDARKNHFPKVLARIDRFLVSEWSTYLGLWHSWATTVSREILKRSGLEAYPPKSQGQGVKPYVMDKRLALFLYNRLAGFGLYRLAIEQQSAAWVITGASTNFAFGSHEQMEALIGLLDKLLEMERPHSVELRSKAAALQGEFAKICAELDYAIASRRLRKLCDLVPFLWLLGVVMGSADGKWKL